MSIQPAHAPAEEQYHTPRHEDLAHQFETMEQQNESYVVGMWTFLVTEIMFFGALFLAYTLYRMTYADVFADAHVHLNIWLGGINTLILLFSSLCMALAVHAAQIGSRKIVMAWLSVVVLCAVLFLGIKGIEYYEKYTHHLIPGPNFSYHGTGGHSAGLAGAAAAPGVGAALGSTGGGFARPDAAPERINIPMNSNTERADKAQLFFSIYFAMTGLHAIHVIIGIMIMLVLIGLYAIKHESVRYFMPVELTGLYWHFVDIVWIFLFPMLYLIGPQG